MSDDVDPTEGENNFRKLLTVLCSPAQDVENTYQQLLTERSLDVATGAQLDIIGVIVGQTRGGFGDEDFRRLCRARVATNRSSGTVPQMIKIVDLFLVDDTAYIHFINQGDATQLLRIEDIAVTDALADLLMTFIHDAQACGVRTIVESTPAAPGTTFEWDLAGRGWDSGAPFIDARD